MFSTLTCMLFLLPLCSCFPDLLLIFYYWKAIGDKFFVVHHVAALYAYYYVLVSALLSNSRTCRQDGKETTKSEQLCPVRGLGEVAQSEVSTSSVSVPEREQTRQRRTLLHVIACSNGSRCSRVQFCWYCVASPVGFHLAWQLVWRFTQL